MSWSSVTFASPKVQRPVLFDGLRNLRTGNPAEVGKEHQLCRLCRGHLVLIEATKADPRSYTKFPMVKAFGNALVALKEGLEAYDDIAVGADELQALDRAD